MKLSAKQVVTFLIPYIDIAVAAFVAWALVHLHFLGIFHIDQNAAAKVISSSVVFGLTALLSWASHHFKWLPLANEALDRRALKKAHTRKKPVKHADPVDPVDPKE